jgi:hypothetical protein
MPVSSLNTLGALPISPSLLIHPTISFTSSTIPFPSGKQPTKDDKLHNSLRICPHGRPDRRALRLLSRLHRRHHRAALLPHALPPLFPAALGPSLHPSADHHILAHRGIIRRPARNALLLEIRAEELFVICSGSVCVGRRDAVT